MARWLILGLAMVGLSLPLVSQQTQTKPPTQPPAQRPPGASPASQIPPHAAPKTAPRTVQTLPSYEGQTVSSVELAGWPGLDSAPILAKLPLKAGQPFSRALVDQSIALLKSPGGVPPSAAPQPHRLKDVQLQILPETRGVRVMFLLEPAVYFGVYQFPGALQFTYSRLLEASSYQSQQPYTELDVRRATANLERYFQEEGYFLAKVKPALHLDATRGLANVAYGVELGPRAKFGEVVLEGATPALNAQLQPLLRSWMARLRRTAVIPGKPYSHTRLTDAAQYLQSALNSREHLSAQVQLSGAKYDPKTNRAAVTFRVDAGPVVELKVQGVHLWPWNKKSLIPIYQESRVDPELIQEGQNNLANSLSASGYFNAKVTTTVTTAGGGTRVSSQTAGAAPANEAAAASSAPAATEETITYTVVKGPRHDVEDIHFTGNQFFNDQDLLAQVTIKPEGYFFFQHGSFSQQLLRTSVSNIQALYQAAGYSSVRVTPRVTHPGGNTTVTFQVVEGPQDYVNSLTFVGNTVPPEQLAPDGLRVGPGTPFAQKLISADKAQILAHYYMRGYLNASMRATAQQEAGHPHLIDVIYTITQGPRVRTLTVTTLGRQITQQRLVDRTTANLQAEKLLTENDMLTAESRLYEPGIFDWTEVRPRRPITTQTQEDVVIKVHEARRNTLLYGFGFDYTNRGGSIPSGTVALPGLPIVGLPNSFKTSQSSFFGPSGNIQYTRINIGGKAETLTMGAFAGRLDQRANITFTNPSLFWTNFSGNLQLSGEIDAENPIFSSRDARIGYQLEHALNPDKTTNVFLRYTFSETTLSRLLIPALVPERDLNVRLSTLSATFLRDTRDNPLDAHKGFLESYEADYNPSALGSSVNFAKVITQTAYYHHVLGDIIWANSVRVGFDHSFGNSFVPLSEQFFTGGGSTLRGFPLDGAGPQKTIPACGNPNDPSTCSLIQVPVGGNALFILNSELRIPTPRIDSGLGVALFYDGGNVFSHLGFHNLGAAYTNSVGIGLRYQTPVGPIRIDLGHNLNPLPGVSATQLFITLGQAF